jgi:dTDP-4-dehydrorhamnose reductase
MPTILVTGANGQLGNELRLESKSFYGYDFIFTDLDTLDITQKQKVAEFIESTLPDWIINCAAYTQVDRAENDKEAAFLVNSTAVKHIAESVKGTVCRLIHISTDYVFDGTANTPYDEMAPVNPVSVYGKSKLEGEKAAMIHSNTMIIRTSWLYSSFGNNFLKTILKNAALKKSLNVVFDQTGTPTYAADLAEVIMHIVSGVIRNQLAFTPGIYNYSNEGVCSWYDFALEIVSEAGSECHINPILTAEYPTPASRPVYSVLNKARIRENYSLTIPHWRASMKKCVNLLK